MRQLFFLSIVLLAMPVLAAPPTEQMLQKIRDAAPAQAPAQPAKPRKVLIFHRPAGFRHSSIETGAAAIKILGEKPGAFLADATDDPGAFSAANLEKYDAICLLNVTGNFLDTDEQKKAMIDFVKSGKGIIGIHSATDAFYDWPEYGQMMGGYFDGHPWNAGDTVTLKVDEPGHPINKAFSGKPFTVTDEIYQFKPEPYSRRSLRVLTSLDTSRTNMDKPGLKRGKDGDYAVSWIRTFGQGRVFYCSLGHREDIYWNPTVLAHYLAGIQFALGDLQADAAPSQPQSAAIHADEKLTAAERLFDDGQREKAAAIYRELFESDQPEHVRIAALRGLASSSNDGIQVLVDQLQGQDRATKLAAARMLQEVRDPRATQAILTALGAASPPVQAVLADALAARGDKTAAPAVAKLAASSDDVARLAAVKALGKLGGPEQVDLLAGLAARSKGELRDAARASLATLRGPDVNGKIVAGALSGGSDPAVIVEFVRALGERQADEAVPQLLELARSPQSVVRRETFRVLGQLAGPEHLEPLLGLLIHETDTGVLPFAERAALSVAQRGSERNAAIATIGSAAASAQGLGRAALLRLLSTLGGDAALRIVRADLSSSSSEIREAAARAMANWPGPEAAPDLLDLAQTGEGTVKVLALRGYIRLAGQTQDPAARLDMYRRAMALAERPDEKRLVLAGLSELATADALKLAKLVSTDPAVKTEAQQAIQKIEQSLAAR